jgi:hypothetical protein
MDVGEQCDTQAIERRRKSRNLHRGFRDTESMTFVSDTVGNCAGEPADRSGERPFERGAASDMHGCGYSSG